MENIRCRNKDVKIKKLLAQPKNTKVKHKGIVVRKMTVRYCAIFPASRWQKTISIKCKHCMLLLGKYMLSNLLKTSHLSF